MTDNVTAPIDRLHEAGLVDMHFDMLMDMHEKPRRSNPLTTDYLPKLEAGGIGVVMVNIFIEERYLPEMGLRVALDQVARLYAELDRTDRFALCRSYEEIRRARERGQIALVLAMEGVEPLGRDLQLLRIFYELGLRELGLSHARRNWAADGGLFASSGSSPAGLTAFGRELVQEAQRLGIIIDLAHLNDAGIEDVLALTNGPVIISHTNPRRFHNIERNSTDDQMKAVVERGGVVGIGAILLSADKEKITLDHYAEHIEYAVDLLGIEGVGLGFDFFEFIYRTMPPEDQAAMGYLEFIPDLLHHGHARHLTAKLIERGFAETELRKILSENFMRIFKELL